MQTIEQCVNATEILWPQGDPGGFTCLPRFSTLAHLTAARLRLRFYELSKLPEFLDPLIQPARSPIHLPWPTAFPEDISPQQEPSNRVGTPLQNDKKRGPALNSGAPLRRDINRLGELGPAPTFDPQLSQRLGKCSLNGGRFFSAVFVALESFLSTFDRGLRG